MRSSNRFVATCCFVALALLIAACAPTPTATPIPSPTSVPPTAAPATAAATVAATVAATTASVPVATTAATAAATTASVSVATTAATVAATTAATAAPTKAAAVVSTAASTAAAKSGPKIAVVTDVGRVDDRSFNQSAWEGAQAAAKDLGGTAKYLVPNGPEDYAPNIQSFADQGYDVIVTVGFALGDATRTAAPKYPKIKFIGVDQFQGATVDNVTGLIFPEDQSGFLAGILAAGLTKSGIIGSVLGTDQVPPVVRFKEGYEAGARWAKPDIKIISIYYPGGLDKAFNDPVWGAQTAGQELDNGADVIFGAGGQTGNGALQELAKRTTKDKPLYCIGVDTDQWETLPEAHPCLVSSAMKLIIPGVSGLIKQAVAGSIKAGNFTGDVGLAPYHDFDTVIPAALKQKITQAAADLKAGKLQSMPTAVATGAATSAATMAATTAATAPK